MKKLSNSSKWSIAAFVNIFTISMMLVDAVNSFYAKKSLHSDTDLLLYQFHDARTKARKVLD